jgi:spermidine synthase
MVRFLFPVSLFLSALLLFSVQPMAAKTLLPAYGGTPAVWTVCMLFFQIILLVSYAYVWGLSFFNKPFIWRTIHTGFAALSVLFLPLTFHPIASQGVPEWSILLHLVTQLGFPLLLIGNSDPLLQLAYSQTKEKNASDPYFLYVASNLGSLIALLSYPWVIERFLGLTYQFHIWTIGYVIYLIGLMVVLYGMPYQPLPRIARMHEALPWRDMLYWVFLSFVPCSLMLGVTLYISTDIAATPLFWVIPLALYLLTFVITFNAKPLITHNWVIRNSLFFLIFTLVGFILGVNMVKAWQLIFVNLLSFFVLALLCHGELFQRRPQAQGLTLFYFCLALGGVLAGIFNGLLAPNLFNQVYEYPLAILFSILILPIAKQSYKVWVPLSVFGLLLFARIFPELFGFMGLSFFQIAALLALILMVVWQYNKLSLFLSMSVLFGFIFLPHFTKHTILLQKRSFYAVNRVEERDGSHVFFSQSTLHGMQFMHDKTMPTGFTSYYGAIEPVVKALQNEFNTMAVTIIGLGAGTMVCQFRKADTLHVIEIDQQVIDIAKNTGLFTYLKDCPASVEIIKNDGRLAVENLQPNSQQLLIMDAFNSDAIPMHLMTLEAFSLYKTKITHEGVILVNISNRHLNLLPVINTVGHALDLMVFYTYHKGNPKLGQFNSVWALLTANESLANQLMRAGEWRFLTDEKQVLWTDDYSNIIPLLKY